MHMLHPDPFSLFVSRLVLVMEHCATATGATYAGRLWARRSQSCGPHMDVLASGVGAFGAPR